MHNNSVPNVENIKQRTNIETKIIFVNPAVIIFVNLEPARVLYLETL